MWCVWCVGVDAQAETALATHDIQVSERIPMYSRYISCADHSFTFHKATHDIECR